MGERQSDFPRSLDELPVPVRRAVDNAGFLHAGSGRRAGPDAERYDRPVQEFPPRPTAAQARGSVMT